MPDFERIHLPVFVTKDGAAGHDFELRQLRQVVDDGFRDAVAEVFRLGFAATVNEGQDGQRIYGAAARATPPTRERRAAGIFRRRSMLLRRLDGRASVGLGYGLCAAQI